MINEFIIELCVIYAQYGMLLVCSFICSFVFLAGALRRS